MTTPDIAGQCEKLRVWPSPKTGADYSVVSIKAQMAEAANTIECQAAEIERLRALLMLARPFIADDTEATCDLADRIDAALTGEES